jgi:glycerol-3-phosphate dehydrogenase
MVPRAKIGHTNAITFLSPIDGRVMLVLPWGDRSYIGTTDTDAPADPENVRTTEEDVLYLLRSANALFPAARLGPEDVSLSWAGLRPLIAAGGGAPGAVSREHVILEGPRGLLTIAGGKLTTYRRMAVEMVDRVAAALGREKRSWRPDAGPSATEPLPGGEPFSREIMFASGVRQGLSEATVAHLVGQYGSETRTVFELIADHPDLSDPIHPHHGAVGAQVVHAVRNEYARQLDDVLYRRLSLTLETPDAGLAAAQVVARLMGHELGWDDTRRRLEVDRYRSVVDAVPRARPLSSR